MGFRIKESVENNIEHQDQTDRRNTYARQGEDSQRDNREIDKHIEPQGDKLAKGIVGLTNGPFGMFDKHRRYIIGNSK